VLAFAVRDPQKAPGRSPRGQRRGEEFVISGGGPRVFRRPENAAKIRGSFAVCRRLRSRNPLMGRGLRHGKKFCLGVLTAAENW